MAARVDALRDLAERLAECNGAIRLASTVMTMAAAAALELYEAPAPDAPDDVQPLYNAQIEAGAFIVAKAAEPPIAFCETQAAAERVAAALNVLSAIEERENASAQGQGEHRP